MIGIISLAVGFTALIFLINSIMKARKNIDLKTRYILRSKFK